MMNSIEVYKDINTPSLFFPSDLNFPLNMKVVPTEQDYRKGYVKRSFCLYISSGKIIEILPSKINKFSSNFFIKTKTIKWIISGPEKNIYKNNILFERGVFERNLETLQNLENIGFKNIKNFIDPLDLYKN
jgi:hypothetical protein